LKHAPEWKPQPPEDETMSPPDAASPDLTRQQCQPCHGGMSPMTEEAIRSMLPAVEGWSYENGELTRTFVFKNFHQTMAFVNALAWIAHQQDHHPNLEVGYKTCKVRYSTHAIRGISENDFICASKINALLLA
jgi:4a-hydroxytetrahydrobiopterin dehydratase